MPVEKLAAGPQSVGGPSASTSTVGQPESEPSVQVIVTILQNQNQERHRDELSSQLSHKPLNSFLHAVRIRQPQVHQSLVQATITSRAPRVVFAHAAKVLQGIVLKI
ncbi:hypothetical protein BU17DRAFT_101953 [Hysterangium stoloniferum]|nr:hypothetical protein BU17DRAFT_101953 [Hysterangium stoloniferum]